MERILFGERLKQLRTELGLTLQKLGDLIGVTTGYLSELEQGKKTPGGEILEPFATKLNVNINWLLAGIGEMFIKKERPAMLVREEVATYYYQYEGREFVLVPLRKTLLSSDKTPESGGQSEIQFAFRRDWIRKYGDPKNMSMIKMPDDTMEPTLNMGDVILIDHGRTSIEEGIYAIEVKNKLSIKRLQYDNISNKVLILCDNKNYKHIETTKEKINIRGKVIWFGRELENFLFSSL